MVSKKEVKNYLDLPWSYTIEPEDDYFVVYVNELPGVCSDGKTVEEAMRGVKEAISAAIELSLEQGKEIPIPIQKSLYRGKIAYRTSPERHYLIAKLAQTKHESLSKTLDLLVDQGLNQTSRRREV